MLPSTRPVLQFSEPWAPLAVQLLEAGDPRNMTLHIVLSCTNRKRVGAEAYPRLREVAGTDAEPRAARWIDRINSVAGGRPVHELYIGEYWRSGVELASTASRYEATQVWVLSAGLGLVHFDDVVPAYGATLASGHPDSVVTSDTGRRHEVQQAWWTALAAWKGPNDGGRPRRLAELAALPDARLLLCAGPDYLEAAAADLAAAHRVLGEGRLAIFGSGNPLSGLASVWVRVPGHLRMRFGGSMSSTGARAACAAVEELAPSGSLDAPRARERVERWAATTDPLPRLERKRLSNQEVEDWIVEDARGHPDSSNKSAALRRLRDGGRACEQSRFGRLYDAVIGAAT